MESLMVDCPWCGSMHQISETAQRCDVCGDYHEPPTTQYDFDRDPDFPDVDPVTGDERETTDENGDPL